jgi:hypothetical protein
MAAMLDVQFKQFLEADLHLPAASIAMAVRHHTGDRALLPIVLWKYGLATFDQVNAMFDWLEAHAL